MFVHVNVLSSASTDGSTARNYLIDYTHSGQQMMDHCDLINSSTHSIMFQQPQQSQTIPSTSHVQSQQLQYQFCDNSNYGNSRACDSFNAYMPHSSPIVTPSVNITTVTSTLQTSVPIYSLGSQSNAPLATSQHSSSSFTFRSRRILQVVRSHYPELVRLLPMNDDIFIAELYKNNLLAHNLKAAIGSLPTRAERTTKFLDDVIVPSAENNDGRRFNVLLTVMMNSDDDAVKHLAKTISCMLNQDCFQSDRGAYSQL